MAEKKILLVDDDWVCLRFMEVLLEDRYILKVAQNGEQALSIAEKFDPDLVVLDVMMPGIDGFEVCNLLTDSDRSEKTKIVFISAKEPSLQKRNDFFTYGYGFLLKPFGLEDLNNQVDKILAS